MTPVKPGRLSRIVSISRMTESSERLWMMRPSCSVIEQKVQPPKQPRMMRDREADHLPGGDLRAVCRRTVGCGYALRIRQAEHVVHLGRGQRNRRRVEPDVAVAVACTSARALPGLVSRCSTRDGVGVEHRVALTCS